MATVKDINKTIFRKLAAGTNINIDAFHKIRVFLTEEEHERLANSLHLLSTYVFSRNVCFALVELDAEIYFLTVGLVNELNYVSLQPIDNRNELSLAIVAKCEVERLFSVNETTLSDKIFVSPEVEDVQWEDIEVFFPVVQTYKVKDSVAGIPVVNEYLKRLALFALCCHNNLLILDFESSTLQKYIDVIDAGDPNIPVDNLLHSLGSNYWKFCFIDLYRCVERLFVLGWVHNYKTTMNSGLPPQPIYEALKNRFKIVKREDDNINYLFSLLSPAALSMLDGVRGTMNHDNYIYQELRNKIVHYQKDDAVINNISSDKWNMVVRFMLVAILELYPQFSAYIAALPNE